MGGNAPQSQCTPKTPEPMKLQRRRRKGHNSREACSSLTLLADARVTKKKKSTESNPGGRIDAKDQRPET